MPAAAQTFAYRQSYNGRTSRACGCETATERRPPAAASSTPCPSLAAKAARPDNRKYPTPAPHENVLRDTVKHCPENFPRTWKSKLSRLHSLPGLCGNLLLPRPEIPSTPAAGLRWKRETLSQ